MFTVNYGPLKNFEIVEPELRSMIGSDSVLEDLLDAVMQKTGVKVTYPDEAEFVAAVPESHRKGEKAYHVKAFRGSKDGT